MWSYNYNNELYHHGINGMRWGKRNGPPYPLSAGAHSSSERAAGTEDWSDEAKREARKEKRKARLQIAFDQTEKNGKDKPNISPAEKITKSGMDAWNAASDIYKQTQKDPYTELKKEARSLSDEELRKRINRLDMEKRYMNLTNDEVFNGKSYVEKVIDIGNDVATLALSAAAIYAMVRKIKKGVII